MNAIPLQPDHFFHVRIIVGVVVGLSVSRILTGIARFVQHPVREQVYPIHLGWVAYMLLSVIHFWWFEFGLLRINPWTFEIYVFVLSYAALYFFICAVLLPERLEEYAGFADYFHSRQRWFYGLLATMAVVDVVDTLLKGTDHFLALGLEYPVRQAFLLIMSLGAIFASDRRYHGFFVTVASLAQISWILRRFASLN